MVSRRTSHLRVQRRTDGALRSNWSVVQVVSSVARIAAQMVAYAVARIAAQIVVPSVAQIGVRTRTRAQIGASIGASIGAETLAVIVDRIDAPTGATKMVAREIESASVHRYAIRFVQEFVHYLGSRCR